MYIEPNTNIRILRNVPLNNTYKNTIYFNNAVEQVAYFYSKIKHTLNNQSYQRVNKGVCRVNIKAEQLYDCNYMMFQNESFGTKWFYAFINKIEYINNVVAEIHFEIDVMQTWFFDYTLKESFVEREHSVTDEIGDNIEAESVDIGEYVYDGFVGFGINTDYYVIIGSSKTDDVIANFYDNNVCGNDLYAFQKDSGLDYSSFMSKLRELSEASGNITTMYLCPTNFIKLSDIDENNKITNIAKGVTIEEENLISCSGTERFGNYKPKNNKMYTYPYNFLTVCTPNSSSLALRYEFFEGDPKVKIDTTFLQPVQATLRPINYKGSTVHSDYMNMCEQLTIADFPTCSTTTDLYKEWFAQNCVPMALNSGSSYLGLVGSLASGSIVGSIGSGSALLHNTKQNISNSYQASIKADNFRGNGSNGNVNASRERNQFYSSRTYITEQKCRIIDDYFTMYGYQTNRVKIPNINAREHYTYVKTCGCNIVSGKENENSVIVGGLPTDDLHKIVSIYDNGITFWKNGNNIGDYSLDNSAYDNTPNV